jgi:putative photosynthetic complex assembly protein
VDLSDLSAQDAMMGKISQTPNPASPAFSSGQMRAAFSHPVTGKIITAEDAKRERQARLLIKFLGMLAVLAFLLALLAQTTGIGAAKTDHGQAVATYDVTMMEAEDGTVALRSAKDGAVLVGFDRGRGGFLRNSIRAFSLKRRQLNVAPEVPFTVTRWESGHITMTDIGTGHQIPVDAFGPTVTAMFAPLVGVKK